MPLIQMGAGPYPEPTVFIPPRSVTAPPSAAPSRIDALAPIRQAVDDARAQAESATAAANATAAAAAQAAADSKRRMIYIVGGVGVAAVLGAVLFLRRRA